MLRWLRIAWGLCLTVFVVLLATHYVKRIDPRVAALYAGNVRRLQGLHARLGEHLLELRSDLILDYDRPNSSVDALDRVHKALAIAPGFLPKQARTDLEARVAESRAMLEQKEAQFEEFKKQHAVLRNSKRYVPVAAAKLVERIDARPDGGPLAARVKELLSDLLLYELLPEDAFRTRVERGVDELKTAIASATVDERTDGEVFLRHVQAILKKQTQVEDLTRQVLDSRAADRAVDLDAAWVRYYEAALDSDQSRRSALFVLALATLMLAAAEIIVRQRQAVAALRDLSAKLHGTNAELLRERAREKELVELKSRFVSMTSHEFRTPLSVIRSSAELLESYWERWDSSKRGNHLRRIQGSAQEMGRLLDGVLIVERADAGKLDFEPRAVDLAALCHEVVAAVRESFREPPSIECEVNAGGAEAVVDERILRHVLTNLLSNAVKYSQTKSAAAASNCRDDRRPIELSVGRSDGELEFTVRDHGIGIPAGDLPSLFESFHRGSNVGDVPGTGLGLAVVKRLVDRHGGSISVQSKQGEGATFVVTIPQEG